MLAIKGRASPFVARRIITPFGAVELPTITVPKLRRPTLDERQKTILRQALGSDLAFLPGLIPVVGAPLSDMLEDLHMAEMKGLMSDREFSRFIQHDKYLPSTLAALRVWIEEGGAASSVS